MLLSQTSSQHSIFPYCLMLFFIVYLNPGTNEVHILQLIDLGFVFLIVVKKTHYKTFTILIILKGTVQ